MGPKCILISLGGGQTQAPDQDECMQLALRLQLMHTCTAAMMGFILGDILEDETVVFFRCFGAILGSLSAMHV